MRTPLIATVGTRLTKSMRTAFMRKAKKEADKDQSIVLRELIHAYVEDRIIVSPPAPSTTGES